MLSCGRQNKHSVIIRNSDYIVVVLSTTLPGYSRDLSLERGIFAISRQADNVSVSLLCPIQDAACLKARTHRDNSAYNFLGGKGRGSCMEFTERFQSGTIMLSRHS